MDIIKLLPGIYEKFIMFVLIFTRVSALFSTFTIFRSNYVNPRIVIALSAIISMYVLILNQTTQVSYELYSLQLLIQMLIQFIVGFFAGLILNIIFEIFVAIGQIISLQIGLSMASLFDPRFGTITSLTHFYVIMVTILFLYMNGHLAIIKVITNSFSALPLYQNHVSTNLISDILNYSSVIFTGSVMICLTVIIAILLANIALAVMTKFAPQINVFSIGINITMILGLIIIFMTFSLYVETGNKLVHDGMNFLQQSMNRLMN